MARARTTQKDGDREMADAGARFETYIRAAMDEAGLPTLAELYRQSGMGASTWGPWFRGESAPRYNSMKLAVPALNRTPEQLLAAWGGEKAHERVRATQTPDPLVSALHRQSEAIERLADELAKDRADQREATVALLRAVAVVVPTPPGTPAGRTPATPVDTG